MKPSEMPATFYSFENYNTKHRMLTYWYQIREILMLQPTSMLEIGVGTGLVNAYIRSLGIEVVTLDVNPSLRPDHVGSVLELDDILPPATAELVLCARVLHHLGYSQFNRALQQIAYATSRYAIVTLPIDDFRIYFMGRYTSSSIFTFSLPLPLLAKRMLLWRKYRQTKKKHSSLWKINDSKAHSLINIKTKLSQYFDILTDYRIPEDSAHYVVVLAKKH